MIHLAAKACDTVKESVGALAMAQGTFIDHMLNSSNSSPSRACQKASTLDAWLASGAPVFGALSGSMPKAGGVLAGTACADAVANATAFTALTTAAAAASAVGTGLCGIGSALASVASATAAASVYVSL